MKPKPIILIAVAHFIVSRTLFIWAFGREMARFDTGQPPSGLDRVAGGGLSRVLDFPILPLINHLSSNWLPGLLGYLPFMVNSLIWGVIAWFVVSRIVNAKVENYA